MGHRISYGPSTLVLATWAWVLLMATGNVTCEDDPRNSLNEGQPRAISRLIERRPSRPAPLLLISDPNKDPDDLSVVVLAKFLQDEGFIDLRAVITTLGNRQTRTQRGKFMRTVLDELGLRDTQVAVGVDYPMRVTDANGDIDAKATAARATDHQVFLETDLVDAGAEVASASVDMLVSQLASLDDHSAVLLVNAGMPDLAALLKDHGQLAKQKAAKVVIMGGIEAKLDSRGFVIADTRAYNNTSHQASADAVYSSVQQLGIPLVVVDKQAAYEAAVPRSFYEQIAATGHPVGLFLKDQQQRALENLWNGIQKGDMPPALTNEWFFSTFTDINAKSAKGRQAIQQATKADAFDTIWNQVNKLNLYDPLALLAATPGAAELCFAPVTPAGTSSDVRVIGKESIADAEFIRDLLSGMAVQSLTRSRKE